MRGLQLGFFHSVEKERLKVAQPLAHDCGEADYPLSPHPSPLPWGEGAGYQIARLGREPSNLLPREVLFLPLPKGEGWGEGERDTRKPRRKQLPQLLNFVSFPGQAG